MHRHGVPQLARPRRPPPSPRSLPLLPHPRWSGCVLHANFIFVSTFAVNVLSCDQYSWVRWLRVVHLPLVAADARPRHERRSSSPFRRSYFNPISRNPPSCVLIFFSYFPPAPLLSCSVLMFSFRSLESDPRRSCCPMARRTPTMCFIPMLTSTPQMPACFLARL